MRIGMIGLGRIGAFHARNLLTLPGVDSLVVADAAPGVAERTAERLGCEAADSADGVLRSGIDAVLIAAATDAHPQLLLAAVDAGLPTFCEKPVAASPAAAIHVRDRLAGSGVPVQIGYPRRFDPAFVAARAAVLSGELGRLTTVRSTTLDPAPPPAGYLAVSGGIFADCAIHDFDAIRWVTGREVTEVYATGSIDATAGPELFADNNDVSTAACILTMDDGTLGLVSNTRYNASGYDVRLEVHGSADSVAAGWDDGAPIRSTTPGARFPAGPPHTFFMDRLADAFTAELLTFLEVAAGRIESPCTVADALETSWVAEAATISLREHRPVALAEIRR
ncbi:Gfo/Idh/MocA family protein [Nakamurella lactea]|uniref:Gfo/Idh/MocA family protein n=1 Tax=Nakamurella lactea TaxID=459515 RepID=UPI00048AAA98|nr:Gfo/Idh/MocA family oxidoreductase [Nakamurella lactea]